MDQYEIHTLKHKMSKITDVMGISFDNTKRGKRPRKPQKKRGYVYFISDNNGNVKIGVSNEPAGRLKTLQTGNGARLNLLTCIRGGGWKESQLHKRFAEDRINGEWFILSPQIENYIKAIKKSL